MQTSIFAWLLTAALVYKTTAAEVTCWAPDGETIANNKTYVPCNKLGIEQEGVFSSCCQLDGDPDERDLCTISGLCLRNNVISRGYCTDKTWKSPACVNVCGDDTEGGVSNGTVELTVCTDGTYCCGHNNLNCCKTDKAIIIPTQASVVASNVTETAFVTETATPSGFKNATIGLSAVLGLVILVAIGAIFWLLRQNKTLQKQLSEKRQLETMPALQHVQSYHPAHLSMNPESPMLGMASSPMVSEFSHGKPSAEPFSPSEIHGVSRYSELDAATSRPTMNMSPRQASFDHSARGSPLPSPGPYQS